MNVIVIQVIIVISQVIANFNDNNNSLSKRCNPNSAITNYDHISDNSSNHHGHDSSNISNNNCNHNNTSGSSFNNCNTSNHKSNISDNDTNNINGDNSCNNKNGDDVMIKILVVI